MKRILALIMALTIAAATTACGEKPQESAPTEAATEAPAEAATVVSEELRERMKALCEESLADHDFKGAAYIVYKGEEVYSGGTGKANKKEDIDNGTDVVYHVASITKQFTAAAILRLCEEGKMTLDDTLGMYYPDYTIGADITIHNLLCMKSGIPDFVRSYDENGIELEAYGQAAIEGVEEDNTVQENRDALRGWILSQELLFSQGERFSYCNSNYFLLGEIIEKVSGESYFDYLRTRFFEPFDMTTAGFMEDYDNPDAVVAVGYRHISAADLLNYNGAAFGCGDMMASPKDLYKWSAALHGGRVLSSEMYEKMVTPHAEGDDGYSSYGYGLMIADQSIPKVYFHSGSLPCFLSCVMYVPQMELYAAVMSNHSSESVMNTASDMIKLFVQELGLLPAE